MRIRVGAQAQLRSFSRPEISRRDKFLGMNLCVMRGGGDSYCASVDDLESIDFFIPA